MALVVPLFLLWTHRDGALAPRSLVINEVLLLNAHGRLDEQGRRSAWVELANVGASAVRLDDYVLTDDATAPSKGRLPAHSIQPGEQAVVFFSEAEDHTGFSLSSRAALLTLFTRSGETVDAVALPRQTEDRSYGRLPDGTGGFRYFLTPSPGAANRGRDAPAPIPSRPNVRPRGGFFSSSVDVSVTIDLPFDGVEIRYTTDGSAVTPESLLYPGRVRLVASEGHRVLRATAFLDAAPVSHEVMASYFFEEVASAGELPVLSLAMPRHEFDEVHLDIDAHGIASERPVFFQVLDRSAGPRFQARAGLRLHGFTGRVGGLETKKSYRLHFRDTFGEGRLNAPLIAVGHPPLERVVLRAGNDDAFRASDRAVYLRDEIVRRLHVSMGYLASHGAWYELYLNGEYLGVYNLVERIDPDFLDAHDGAASDEGPPAEWDVMHDEEVVAGSDSVWAELRTFVNSADLSDPRAYERVTELADVPGFTDYMVLNIWAQNHDWPHKNFFAARPPGGRFSYLVWDAELTMALYPPHAEADTFERAAIRGASGVSELFAALLASPRYQAFFVERLEHHLGSTLAPDNVVALVEAQARAIQPALEREIRMRHTEGRVAAWRRNVETLIAFARERPDVLRDHVYGSSRISVVREGR